MIFSRESSTLPLIKNVVNDVKKNNSSLMDLN